MDNKDLNSGINENEKQLEFSKKENDIRLQKSLDNYSGWLIKVVGIVGVIMGFIIIGAFWYWVLKML